MQHAGNAMLLTLWEGGQTRHPIDRALLLCAWARPDVAPEQLAQLPLGTVNAALLHMRAALFGPELELQLDCDHCGEELELHLTTGQLLAQAPQVHDAPTPIDIRGYAFRLPDSRDLAAIALQQDADAAALELLERCCVGRPDDGGALGDLLTQAELQLEAADPLADMRLDVACNACSRRSHAAIDVGALVWNDLQHHVRELLAQVHVLARTYGWSESDVLGLSPARRTAYLNLATA
jgi:hypothetical protein